MSAWTNFRGVAVPAQAPSPNRPRFSLTSDIISYRHCSRQHGFFGHDGFVAAQAVQIYYGTIIHQVLDRCHRHYSGLMDVPAGSMPSNDDIESYFGEVENALRSHGVRPASPAVSKQALHVLKVFNRIEGPQLYPRVFDTEYRLESDRGQYVLRGVVDVLAGPLGGGEDPAQREIWDYKGTRMPNLSHQSMQDYIWQMCVYAELYRARSGVLPARAILYFLNELNLDPEPTQRPLRAVYEVQFTEPMIQEALRQFNITAQDIITCQTNNAWPNPPTRPSDETCDICDIRWNCPVGNPNGDNYRIRMPIVD